MKPSMLARAPVMVILPVKELERARDFYVNRLGLEAEGLAADGKFVLRANGVWLALMPKPGGTKAEHTALSFKVDNLAAAIEGAEVARGRLPRLRPAGLQDRQSRGDDGLRERGMVQ